MKKNYYILIVMVALSCMWVPSVSSQAVLRDSVVISFNEQTRMIIYGTDRKEIEKLSRYDFNKLISDVLMKLDSVSSSDSVSRDWVDGKMYLKQKEPQSEKSNEKLRRAAPGEESNMRKSHDAGDVIKVTASVRREDGHVEISADTVIVQRSGKYVRRSPRQGIDLKLGLNTYGMMESAGYNPESFDLRPGGSRFVSVGIVRSIPVVKGRNNSFFMDFGLDISWYNLMFEGDEVIRKESSGVLFTTQTNEWGEEVSLKKNKLVSPHINLTLVPTFTLAGSVVSHVSAGVYGGYRVGGYHKSRPHDGPKSKVSSDFYMQGFHYGLVFELGIRSFPDLFLNYALNSLFEQGKGPQVRMLSFGLRI